MGRTKVQIVSEVFLGFGMLFVFLIVLVLKVAAFLAVVINSAAK